MKRDLYEILCQWKKDKNRRPLLVRGARQVGKTFLVNEFGRREFDSLITLNFEKNPHLLLTWLSWSVPDRRPCRRQYSNVRLRNSPSGPQEDLRIHRNI